MSAKEYKEQLHEALLNLLWRQWGALGVAAHAAGRPDAAVLDPEALLLFTARLARCDQRLYDLVLNWLLAHESLINLPRLKALLKKSTWKDADSLAYMAAVLSENGKKRWKVLAKPAARSAAEYECLFRDWAAGEETYIPHTDALAETYGFRRNVFAESRKLSLLLPRTSASLMLTLRGCVGVTARAEILLLLLASPCCTLAELAERSGYARSSVHELLAEMTAAQTIEQYTENGTKEKKLYSLCRAEDWKRLLGCDSPWAFPRWGRIYDALGMLWTAVNNPRLEHLSEQTFVGEIARVMKQGARQAFLQSGLAVLQNVSSESYADLPAALDCL